MAADGVFRTIEEFRLGKRLEEPAVHWHNVDDRSA